MDYRLFKFHLNPTLDYSLMILHGNNIDIKRGVINERSFIFWHMILGHIFIDRLKDW
jgi:hypothetical protein